MKSVISTFLLTLILVVTIGVPVFRHSCEELDESKLSLLSEKNCCTLSSASTETKIDSKCCSIEQIDTAFYYETLVNKVSSIPVVLFAVEQLEVFKNIRLTEISASIPVFHPPPLANRELHNRIQLYLL